MIGVILAGGNGTRLLPLTRSVNKHLLPVGSKPMIQHCLEKMTDAGIKKIMVITGGEHLGGIAEHLGSGKDYGCEITYRVQDDAGGIAQALSLVEGFGGRGEKMCVILGDNMFDCNLNSIIRQCYGFDGATVVLKQVEDPERFGVAVIDSTSRRITEIVEKPTSQVSNLAVTGIYFYDYTVFDKIRECTPSSRGEMEITDVNNLYCRDDSLQYCFLPGWWTDAGTHESYRTANELMLGIDTKICDNCCH